MKKIFIACSLTALLGLGTTSCDNEPFEHGTPLLPTSVEANQNANKIFVANTQLGSQFAFAAMEISHTPASVDASVEEIEVTIELQKPAEEDFTAKLAVVGTDEVRQSFNSLYGSNVQNSLVDGLLSMSNPEVAFKVGQKTAVAKVVLDKTKVNTNFVAYQVGAVQIVSSSSEKAVASEKYKNFYIYVSYNYSQIKPVNNNNNFAGKTKINLSSATFTTNGDNVRSGFWGASSNAIDGRSDNVWYLFGENNAVLTEDNYFEVTFTPQTVSGLAITPPTAYGRLGDSFSQCIISVREGTEWVSLGRVSFNPVFETPSNLVFHLPVENCSGVRIHPIINKNYIGIGELEIYP